MQKIKGKALIIGKDKAFIPFPSALKNVSLFVIPSIKAPKVKKIAQTAIVPIGRINAPDIPESVSLNLFLKFLKQNACVLREKKLLPNTYLLKIKISNIIII